MIRNEYLNNSSWVSIGEKVSNKDQKSLLINIKEMIECIINIFETIIIIKARQKEYEYF